MSEAKNKMSLIEALCVINTGWSTDEEHDIFIEAHNVVSKESKRIVLNKKLENLDKDE